MTSPRFTYSTAAKNLLFGNANIKNISSSNITFESMFIPNKHTFQSKLHKLESNEEFREDLKRLEELIHDVLPEPDEYIVKYIDIVDL